MAWFRNHYVCVACEGHWLCEHAAVIEADCPFCRAYDVAPYKSDDRTAAAKPKRGVVVLLAPRKKTAAAKPARDADCRRRRARA